MLIHQLAREFWFYETPFPVNYIGYHFLEDRWLKNYVDVPTVTVSQSTKKDLLSLGFKHVSVSSVGLNFKPLDAVPKKKIIQLRFMLGRLKRAKGPDFAVKAFRFVKERFPTAEFWVIGDSPLKEELVRTAGDGVRFFGNLSNDERRDLIGRAWVLVHPSIREGFPLNVTEANALGAPCVAYNVPGVKCAVADGDTGLLVEPRTPEALVKGICRAFEDEALRIKLSENALAYSRGFSWDKVADEFMRVIESGGLVEA